MKPVMRWQGLAVGLALSALFWAAAIWLAFVDPRLLVTLIGVVGLACFAYTYGKGDGP